MKLTDNRIIKRVLTIGAVALSIGLLYSLSFLPQLTASAQSATKSSTGVVEITESQFAELVFDFNAGNEWEYIGDKPAIIDFYAEWCGPCRRLRPRLEQLASEYSDDIVIYSIDAEKAMALSKFMDIRAYPTLLFIPVEGDPTMAEGLLSLKVLRQQVEQIKSKK